MADRVIEAGDCADPRDLSSLAEAVVTATGSQRALVERLPIERFRNAQPNDGYTLAAALLYEGALGCVMTLNFDLAMSHALGMIGAETVSVVAGPQDHSRFGTTNVVYLHRNVDADPDAWVLTRWRLETEWRDAWEEAVANHVLAAPVIVFAGLGSPAAVLIETAERLRAMLPGETQKVIQVDPIPRENSAFFAALRIPEQAYVQTGWSEFMRRLAQRLTEEHQARLSDACASLLSDEGWPAENVEELCRGLGGLGLLGLGRIRAKWTLSDRAYERSSPPLDSFIADLVLAIGMIERLSTARAEFGEDGVVEFWRGDRMLAEMVVLSGRGTRRWLSLEGLIRSRSRRWTRRGRPPRVAIVSGVVGARPDVVAAPPSVLAEQPPESIVTVDDSIEIFSVDELRADPGLVDDILGL